MSDIITVLILILVLAVIISLNCLFLHRAADYIYGIVESVSLDRDSSERILELEKYWHSNKKWFALSVSFQDIDKLDEQISNLRSAYDSSNRAELDRIKKLLLSSTELFIRYERLSVENIL